MYFFFFDQTRQCAPFQANFTIVNGAHGPHNAEEDAEEDEGAPPPARPNVH